MTTILVTGATGTVGCEVARLLGAHGLPVRAALRDPGGAVPAGVAPVPFDFGRPETYDLALRGVEALFLMRPPAITDTRRYVDPLIAAAREAGVRRVVFLSVLGAERLPVVPHRRIERSLEASGMAHTFLRPSFFMQNLSGVRRADIRRGHIVVPAGIATRLGRVRSPQVGEGTDRAAIDWHASCARAWLCTFLPQSRRIVKMESIEATRGTPEPIHCYLTSRCTTTLACGCAFSTHFKRSRII